ncbi:MAG: hypothetical protein HKM04_02485 [Legionellales bacterium]|nr:hypothetical protein [Legionellales bacterium]
MSNILFKTNAVHRVVDGREMNKPLYATLDSTKFSSLEELQSLLMNELRTNGVQARINSIEVNHQPVLHIDQVKEAPAGADLVAKVTQFTAEEVNNLKETKVKRDKLNQTKEVLSKKEALLESLEKKTSLLKKEITELKGTSQELLSDLLVQAQKLRRHIPQAGLTAIHAAQKNTLFASSPMVPASPEPVKRETIYSPR